MNRKISKLCVVAPTYPTESHPVHTFIDQLLCEFADNGVECSVISPYSITKRILRNYTLLPKERKRVTQNGNTIHIYSPRYLSFSNSLSILNTSMFTFRSFRNAVIEEYKRLNLEADAVYGHFIFPCGMCAADLGEMLGIPSFLAYGESSPSGYKHVKKPVLQEKMKKLSGIVSVSSENKRELLEIGLVENSDTVGVFPNAIDGSKFYKIEKDIARKQLGIDNEKFVVVFVGDFIERKGVAVLANVLNQLEDVYSIFIGAGSDEPQCKNIVFKGRVPHEQVHIYLNAADVFVLPTFAEGCCNAIIEAMACGIPIISSDLSFNDDILDENCSIRISPTDSDAIYKAITLLKNNFELQKKLSDGAIRKSEKLRINERAKNIIAFMEKRAEITEEMNQ